MINLKDVEEVEPFAISLSQRLLVVPDSFRQGEEMKNTGLETGIAHWNMSPWAGLGSLSAADSKRIVSSIASSLTRPGQA
jgi:hypothetical protein